MVTDDMLNEIKELFCKEAHVMIEAGLTYIYLPTLKLLDSSLCEGLLCLQNRDGYPTRLFLSMPVAGKCANWSTHNIFGKAWHTWSWNYVEFTDSLTAVLANHLKALK